MSTHKTKLFDKFKKPFRSHSRSALEGGSAPIEYSQPPQVGLGLKRSHSTKNLGQDRGQTFTQSHADQGLPHISAPLRTEKYGANDPLKGHPGDGDSPASDHLDGGHGSPQSQLYQSSPVSHPTLDPMNQRKDDPSFALLAPTAVAKGDQLYLSPVDSLENALTRALYLDSGRALPMPPKKKLEATATRLPLTESVIGGGGQYLTTQLGNTYKDKQGSQKHGDLLPELDAGVAKSAASVNSAFSRRGISKKDETEDATASPKSRRLVLSTGVESFGKPLLQKTKDFDADERFPDENATSPHQHKRSHSALAPEDAPVPANEVGAMLSPRRSVTSDSGSPKVKRVPSTPRSVGPRLGSSPLVAPSDESSFSRDPKAAIANNLNLVSQGESPNHPTPPPAHDVFEKDAKSDVSSDVIVSVQGTKDNDEATKIAQKAVEQLKRDNPKLLKASKELRIDYISGLVTDQFGQEVTQVDGYGGFLEGRPHKLADQEKDFSTQSSLTGSVLAGSEKVATGVAKGRQLNAFEKLESQAPPGRSPFFNDSQPPERTIAGPLDHKLSNNVSGLTAMNLLVSGFAGTASPQLHHKLLGVADEVLSHNATAGPLPKLTVVADLSQISGQNLGFPVGITSVDPQPVGDINVVAKSETSVAPEDDHENAPSLGSLAPPKHAHRRAPSRDFDVDAIRHGINHEPAVSRHVMNREPLGVQIPQQKSLQTTQAPEEYHLGSTNEYVPPGGGVRSSSPHFANELGRLGSTKLANELGRLGSPRLSGGEFGRLGSPRLSASSFRGAPGSPRLDLGLGGPHSPVPTSPVPMSPKASSSFGFDSLDDDTPVPHLRGTLAIIDALGAAGVVGATRKKSLLRQQVTSQLRDSYSYDDEVQAKSFASKLVFPASQPFHIEPTSGAGAPPINKHFSGAVVNPTPPVNDSVDTLSGFGDGFEQPPLQASRKMKNRNSMALGGYGVDRSSLVVHDGVNYLNEYSEEQFIDEPVLDNQADTSRQAALNSLEANQSKKKERVLRTPTEAQHAKFVSGAVLLKSPLKQSSATFESQSLSEYNATKEDIDDDAGAAFGAQLGQAIHKHRVFVEEDKSPQLGHIQVTDDVVLPHNASGPASGMATGLAIEPVQHNSPLEKVVAAYGGNSFEGGDRGQFAIDHLKAYAEKPSESPRDIAEPVFSAPRINARDTTLIDLSEDDSFAHEDKGTPAREVTPWDELERSGGENIGDNIGGESIRGRSIGGETIRGVSIGEESIGREAIGGESIGRELIGGESVGGESIHGETIGVAAVAGATLGASAYGLANGTERLGLGVREYSVPDFSPQSFSSQHHLDDINVGGVEDDTNVLEYNPSKKYALPEYNAENLLGKLQELLLGEGTREKLITDEKPPQGHLSDSARGVADGISDGKIQDSISTSVNGLTSQKHPVEGLLTDEKSPDVSSTKNTADGLSGHSELEYHSKSTGSSHKEIEVIPAHQPQGLAIESLGVESLAADQFKPDVSINDGTISRNILDESPSLFTQELLANDESYKSFVKRSDPGFQSSPKLESSSKRPHVTPGLGVVTAEKSITPDVARIGGIADDTKADIGKLTHVTQDITPVEIGNDHQIIAPSFSANPNRHSQAFIGKTLATSTSPKPSATNRETAVFPSSNHEELLVSPDTSSEQVNAFHSDDWYTRGANSNKEDLVQSDGTTHVGDGLKSDHFEKNLRSLSTGVGKVLRTPSTSVLRYLDDEVDVLRSASLRASALGGEAAASLAGTAIVGAHFGHAPGEEGVISYGERVTEIPDFDEPELSPEELARRRKIIRERAAMAGATIEGLNDNQPYTPEELAALKTKVIPPTPEYLKAKDVSLASYLAHCKYVMVPGYWDTDGW